MEPGRRGGGITPVRSLVARLRRAPRTSARPSLPAAPRVAVVTDSTAALTPGEVAAWSVQVVPLDVAAGTERFLDGVDLGPGDIAELLSAGSRITTSQPPPATFAAVYRRCADLGAQEVVSVHLSGGLSGTVRAAGLAAQTAPLPVHVVDTACAGMGIGFAVLAAAHHAADHPEAAAPEVAAVAARTAASTSAWFVVDSLDHLRRGGRISAPAAALGSVLGLRPVLTLREGRIEVAERLRGRTSARDRLCALLTADLACRDRPVQVAVHHLDRPDVARDLAARIEHLDGVAHVVVRELGAVLGGHLGLGALAVIVADT